MLLDSCSYLLGQADRECQECSGFTCLYVTACAHVLEYRFLIVLMTCYSALSRER